MHLHRHFMIISLQKIPPLCFYVLTGDRIAKEVNNSNYAELLQMVKMWKLQMIFLSHNAARKNILYAITQSLTPNTEI